jgi:hypothetical protein
LAMSPAPRWAANDYESCNQWGPALNFNEAKQ